jgi:ribonucleoside-diphosphate reductase alpha chain
LTAFLADNGEFDFVSFRRVAQRWTRLLDWTIDLAGYPTKAIADRTRALRPLGLGFADLGGLLLRMGLHYDSDQARTLAHDIATAMTEAAREESEELAEKHGLAPALRWGPLISHVARKLGGTGRIRNLQLTAIAPTGTIGLLMDCDTTGIEPIFGVNTTKTLEGGGFIELPNPAIAVAQAKHRKSEEWCGAQTAGNLSATAHLLMVAAVQSAVSSGISKTVNLPANTTPEEIGRVYRLAHALGIKAISVYRDGSKLSQPLSQKKVTCAVCGNESMIPNGTCHVCEVCGATTGC